MEECSPRSLHTREVVEDQYAFMAEPLLRDEEQKESSKVHASIAMPFTSTRPAYPYSREFFIQQHFQMNESLCNIPF